MLAGILTIATLTLTGPALGAAHAAPPPVNKEEVKTCVNQELKDNNNRDYRVTDGELETLIKIVDAEIDKPRKSLNKAELKALRESVESQMRKQMPEASADSIDRIVENLPHYILDCVARARNKN
ncbi:hypothetical protein [Nocardia ninae]|uniref:hypothetical protein n=1 Tax=Nocardia ninae TaxID=356145 RepID=UPI0011BF70F9|nr:hypothetical protein [Nocardia ninae]